MGASLPSDPALRRAAPGLFVAQQIRTLCRRGAVRAPRPLSPRQVQPASLDLRLGPRGFRVAGTFLPGRDTVERHARDLCLYGFSLERGAYLEQGHVYLIPLLEELRLPAGIRGLANPKSSTGRLDVATRLLADAHSRFDEVPPGYRGPLHLLVLPRSFSIRVRAGLALHQIRFFRTCRRLTDVEIRDQQRRAPLALDARGRAIPPPRLRIDEGLYLRIGLRRRKAGPVGYRARRFRGAVDLARVRHYRVEDFFEPIPPPARGAGLMLEPEAFYLFASRERLCLPADLAAVMEPYEVGVGEMRSNYAGFFDCGFGSVARGPVPGSPAVLEVRPHDAPFLVEDDQAFFRLRFERVSEPPSFLYGTARAGSSYHDQDLSPSKHFRPVDPPPASC